MRLRHIEVFHAIKQTGSISKAAALLGVSQPATSKVLQHAEAALGFKLFERVKGRLHATAEAEVLHGEVAALHQGLERLRMLSANLRRFPEGRLRIGCLPSLGLSILPPAIHAFQLSHRSITCEVDTNHLERLLVDLRGRHIDLAVTLFLKEEPGIRTQVLGDADMVYLGPAAGGDITLAEIDVGGLVGLSRGDRVGQLVADGFEALGIPYKPPIEVQTYYLACAFAAAGCGAAIVDEFTARSMHRDGLFIRRIRPRMSAKLAVLTHESHIIRGFYGDFIDVLRDAILAGK
jgi:DNA-binding transcriptional LysR family regulator